MRRFLAAACLAERAGAEDTFPQAPARADILSWLAANSDLKADAVVAMTDEVVAAITDRQDGPGPDGSRFPRPERAAYRALLLGFASPDEAAALCKALRSQSVDGSLQRMP